MEEKIDEMKKILINEKNKIKEKLYNKIIDCNERIPFQDLIFRSYSDIFKDEDEEFKKLKIKYERLKLNYEEYKNNEIINNEISNNEISNNEIRNLLYKKVINSKVDLYYEDHLFRSASDKFKDKEYEKLRLKYKKLISLLREIIRFEN